MPYPGNAEPAQAQIRAEIKKIDTDQRLVFGWASVVADAQGRMVVDHQGDLIYPEDIEKAAYDFVLTSRQAGDMHEVVGTGRLVESMVFTVEKMQALGIPEGTMPTGWWVGFHIDDDEKWDLVKKGVRPMFSIGGTGYREPIKEGADG